MSAILEAPTMMVDVESGSEMPPGSQGSSESMGFLPTTFVKRKGFLRENPLSDLSAVPDPRRRLFPLPQNPGLGAKQPEACGASSEDVWVSPRSPIPQTPGEVLLREFDALYEKYQRRVYRQCFRMLGNAEDAEDLTQEVFLQLYRKAHTFRGESTFSTWLHRLTVNTVLMRLRRNRRWREVVTSMDAPPGVQQEVSDVLTKVRALPAPATDTLDRISLDVAIAQLSSGYKEIFLLHDQEGYRHDEIAKLLGITEGTSKSQLHKARLKLRELIVTAGKRRDGHHDAPAARASRKRISPSPPVAEFAFA
ncbi:MAG: RNA polymerase sigma factor [Terriglobia bacterium]